MASRRGLLKGLLFFGGAAVIMARPWARNGPSDVVFEPVEGAAPFRRLVTGAADISSGGGSATNAAFVGITVPGQGPDANAVERMRGAVAGRLLGDWRTDGPVPMTYFTDIQCPLCPAFEAQLYDLAEETGAVPVARELPLFPGSDRAARLVLAAQAQGFGEAVRGVLRATRAATLPEPRVRRVLAEVAGLDVDAVFVARGGAEVAERLSDDLAMSEVLRIPGTPSAVIGRTVVVGRVPSVTLRAIVEVERAAGPPDEI